MLHRTVDVSRVLLALLLLCAVACAQTASFATEHSHPHSSQHCCGLCHAGPLPFLRPALSSSVTPILAKAWLERTAEPRIAHQVLLTGGCSRAPPV